LLDFIRRELFLTGTKEGCREGDCGACTVLIGAGSDDGSVSYSAVNSCLIPLGTLHGKHLLTIEGLPKDALSPFQQALIKEGGIQCGFCTPGLIMSVTGFLLSEKDLSIEHAIEAIAGNICRCTGYKSIKRALESFLCDSGINPEAGEKRMESLIENGFIPPYFRNIPELLRSIPPFAEDPEDTKLKPYFAGGTDIMVQKQGEATDINFHFLKWSEERVRVEDGFIVLDAALKVSSIMDSAVLKTCLPQLESCLGLFGSRQIRNQATLGGNLANASPIADLANIFLALDGRLTLQNGDQVREVPLRDFFLGYKRLSKTESERIVKLKLPVPESGFFFNFEKVSRRKHLDVASVNSSVYMKAIDGRVKFIHIAAGGVAPYPLYLKETSSFLEGKSLTSGIILEAALIAQSECSPISDIRGSEEYKRLLLRQLIFAHFMKFNPELIYSPEILFQAQAPSKIF
jgi:xanthine dehydrogenase small subunit